MRTVPVCQAGGPSLITAHPAGRQAADFNADQGARTINMQITFVLIPHVFVVRVLLATADIVSHAL